MKKKKRPNGQDYQTDLPSQQTNEILAPPVVSRGYDGGRGESARQVAIARAKKPRTITYPTYRFRSFTQLVGTTSKTLCAAHDKRRYLFIQNTGTGDLNIAFGTAAIGNNGENSIVIPANTSIEFSNPCPNNEVQAICLPTTTARVIEGFEN